MRNNAYVARSAGQVVIIGGGPGGYEAALVARQMGAEVVLVHREPLGGAAVLTDCVPSKALIAVANQHRLPIDLRATNNRITALAGAQSQDITTNLEREGITLVGGFARLGEPGRVDVTQTDGEQRSLPADAILIATGARPRILDQAEPDGRRILSWPQLWSLTELPQRLIVVGSGVTGAEFAGAYHALGSEVVLVSSRDRVLPGEDADAAQVIEDVFQRAGIAVLGRSRAASAVATSDGVQVTLTDGRTIEGSHVLMAVGSDPNTGDLGLQQAGVDVDERGFITVDRVSRTSVAGVYAADDCTGVLMLASVAAMQGRISMRHALGGAVTPLELDVVSSTVFTEPEIATVGVTQRDLDAGEFIGECVQLPLASNARAKMEGIEDGFVKIFCRTQTRIIAGAVVVSPHASELIHPLTLAVQQRLTTDQLAATFTVYPSLSGSLAEAARRLHVTDL
ncbi:MAG: NAD(P)H-quinone dehydrogenase [Actinomycetales bacterium]